jgi:hypothetical protein
MADDTAHGGTADRAEYTAADGITDQRPGAGSDCRAFLGSGPGSTSAQQHAAGQEHSDSSIHLTSSFGVIATVATFNVLPRA